MSFTRHDSIDTAPESRGSARRLKVSFPLRARPRPTDSEFESRPAVSRPLKSAERQANYNGYDLPDASDSNLKDPLKQGVSRHRDVAFCAFRGGLKHSVF